jgi:hypothetical protein
MDQFRGVPIASIDFFLSCYVRVSIQYVAVLGLLLEHLFGAGRLFCDGCALPGTMGSAVWRRSSSTL